ncbi:MAG TPA: CPBP family intramembrane glutamic endopeptidase [Dehalococcoidia bacterium]|nr:CPBP family intramembrane glutamic endopeptidase [Dehalococcoidia bacterium]
MDIAAGSPSLPPPSRTGDVSGRHIDWTPRDVAIGILLLVGVLVVLPIPVVVIALLFTGQHSLAFLTIEALVGAPLYLLIAAIAASRTFGKYGGGWARLGVRMPNGGTLAWAGAAFAGALAVSIAYGVIIDAFGLNFLKQGCADQVPTEIRSQPYILAITAFLAVVFAPMAEEFFFRGFVFPGIARSWGVPAGIVVSGLLFGSAHLLGNPYLYKSLIQFAAIGMIFAFTYWRSGNIFSSMLAHFTFNLLGVITLAATTCHA